MDETLHKFTFQALGGENQISLYTKGEQLEEIKARVLQEVGRIEAKYSRYREDSVVSRINQKAGRGAVPIDEETYSLFQYAKELCRLSEGLFDITSGILRKAWNFRYPRIPTAEELANLLPNIGMDKFQFTQERALLSRQGMEIDLGGIGKEYAVDRVANDLRLQGVTRALINLGGDIYALGSHPSGEGWHVAIAHPRERESILTVLEIKDGGLATSGDYQRYFELGGRRYCHILNPFTGFPAETFQSVSVVSITSLSSGSLSTVAMLLGPEKGEALLRKEARIWIAVTPSGEMLHSDNLPPL